MYSSEENQKTQCLWPFETSWMGSTQVLMACTGANDANGGYVTQDVPVDSGGAALAERHIGRFNQYVDLKAYTSSEALAVENEYCDITCPDGRAPEVGRAVRVDLRTGVVLAVLAYAAPHREVAGVLGGNDGVVYTTSPTSGRGAVRTYLRFPADPYGKPIKGLKGQVAAVQP